MGARGMIIECAPRIIDMSFRADMRVRARQDANYAESPGRQSSYARVDQAEQRDSISVCW